MDRAYPKLDNAVFDGRLKVPAMPAGHVHRPTPRPARRVDDIYTPRFKSYSTQHLPKPKNQTPQPSLVAVDPSVHAQPSTDLIPGQTKEMFEHWLDPLPAEPRQKTDKQPVERRKMPSLSLNFSRPLAIYSMATVVFIIGLYVSFAGLHTNNVAQAQIKKISSQAQRAGGPGSSTPPSTAKPTAMQVASYSVSPTLPRYIDIPFIGVHARVFQTGSKADGSLGTPGNVYDTAWYSNSSKPGEAGAMLIDGHISSWTTKGVFYNLDHLVAGNIITVTRGDGKIFSYKVLKTATLKASSVDMASLLVSQNTAKPGLNLISCSGDVIPGTNEFDKRIVIYSVLQ